MNIINKTGLFLIPSAHASDKLYAIRPTDTDGIFAFESSCTRSRVNATGVLEMVPSMVPRIEFKNNRPNLLLEPGCTNLFPWPVSMCGQRATRLQCNFIADGSTAGRDIVINGGFDADSSWTKGTGWTISGGVASCNGSTSDLAQSTSQDLRGVTFKITFQVVTRTAGSICVNIGGSDSSDSFSATGTYTVYLAATGATTVNSIYLKSTGFKGSIDNISVKQVDGFTDPFLSKKAYKLIDNASLSEHNVKYSNFSVNNTQIYVLSVFAKAGERSHFYLRTGSSSSSFFNLSSGTCGAKSAQHLDSGLELIGGYYRCWIKFMATSNSVDLTIGIASSSDVPGYSGTTGTQGLFIFGLQLCNQKFLTSFIYDGTEGATRQTFDENGFISSLYEKGLTGDNWSFFIDIEDIVNHDEMFVILILDREESERLDFFVDQNGHFIPYILDDSIDILIDNDDCIQRKGKMCIVMEDGQMKVYINGSRIGDAFSPSTPLQIDYCQIIANQTKLRINAILLFNSALTANEACDLTSMTVPP
jgi:hypothetical protein